MVTNSVNESSLKAHRKRPLTSNAPLWDSFTNWLQSIKFYLNVRRSGRLTPAGEE